MRQRNRKVVIQNNVKKRRKRKKKEGNKITDMPNEMIKIYIQNCKLKRYKTMIDDRLRFIKIRFCAEQLLQLIEEKNEKLKETISSYKGCGRKKLANDDASSRVHKPSFIGFCTLDAILNISRVTNFNEEIQDHPLCDHKIREVLLIRKHGRIWKIFYTMSLETYVNFGSMCKFFTPSPPIQRNLGTWSNLKDIF